MERQQRRELDDVGLTSQVLATVVQGKRNAGGRERGEQGNARANTFHKQVCPAIRRDLLRYCRTICKEQD
jgi:hypothetical protein